MKRAQLISLCTLAALLAAGITGCKNPDKGITQIPGHRPTVANVPPSGPIGDSGKATGEGVKTDDLVPLADRAGFDGWEPNRDMFASDTVYFDFDRKAVKAS